MRTTIQRTTAGSLPDVTPGTKIWFPGRGSPIGLSDAQRRPFGKVRVYAGGNVFDVKRSDTVIVQTTH